MDKEGKIRKERYISIETIKKILREDEKALQEKAEASEKEIEINTIDSIMIN